MRTCSLACYKRHQQRASCNGKREPAAFVKKNQLVTPQGVDRDFNFLTGVERAISKADQDASDRGIVPKHGPRKSIQDRWHPEGALQKYLAENQIIVDRAPKGMSRQKANSTRCTPKTRKIMWTVEWVGTDGERRVRDDCLESSTLSDLYALLKTEQRNAERRKLEHERQGKARQADAPDQPRKKRKMESTENSHDGENASMLEEQELVLADIRAENDGRSDVQTGRDSEHARSIIATGIDTGAGTSTNEDVTNGAESLKPQSNPIVVSDVGEQGVSSRQPSLSPSRIIVDSETAIRQPSQQSNPLQVKKNATSHQDLHFYLLKPHTTSASRVLIPLSSDATLTQSLRRQNVLEFPTIHVLLQSPDELPDSFDIEEQYLKATRQEDAELEDLLRKVSREGGRPTAESSGAAARSDELDETAILEMLRRDTKA